MRRRGKDFRINVIGSILAKIWDLVLLSVEKDVDKQLEYRMFLYREPVAKVTQFPPFSKV